MTADVSAKKNGFKFNWLGTSVILLVSGILLLMGFIAGGELFRMVAAVIMLLIMTLLALIPGYLVFLLAKRNNMAGNAAFSIAFILMNGLFLGVMWSVARQLESKSYGPLDQDVQKRILEAADD